VTGTGGAVTITGDIVTGTDGEVTSGTQ